MERRVVTKEDIRVEQVWKLILQEASKVDVIEERDLVVVKKDMEF